MAGQVAPDGPAWDARSVIDTDEHFTYLEIAPGVIHGVARRSEHVYCNATVIDLGGELVVIDTQARATAARSVLAMCRREFSSPIRYIVNTHHHFDHTFGNSVYRDLDENIQILAHPKAIEALQAEGAHIARQQLGDLEAASRALRESQLGVPGRGARLYEMAQVIAELRDLRLIAPDTPIADRRTLSGSLRSIELVHLGPAHTAGDLFIRLPEDDILLTGDCAIGWTPALSSSDPVNWATVIEKLQADNPRLLLMGHGEPVTASWLTVVRDYLRALVAATASAVERGIPESEVAFAVRSELAARFEIEFDRQGGRYRPWRKLVLRNVRRVQDLLAAGG